MEKRTVHQSRSQQFVSGDPSVPYTRKVSEPIRIQEVCDKLQDGLLAEGISGYVSFEAVNPRTSDKAKNNNFSGIALVFYFTRGKDGVEVRKHVSNDTLRKNEMSTDELVALVRKEWDEILSLSDSELRKDKRVTYGAV